MKVVWVGPTGSDVQECDTESVVGLLNRSTLLLFWENFLGQPLLVMGAPGAHAVTFTYLNGRESFKDLDPDTLAGAATVNRGKITSWYSACYNAEMPEEWRQKITEVLTGVAQQ